MLSSSDEITMVQVVQGYMRRLKKLKNEKDKK